MWGQEGGRIMVRPRYSAQEIGTRGRAIYEQRIRHTVEPVHTGKFLIVDIETGDYEVDEDDFAASDRAHGKHPDGVFYGFRIGQKASGVIGSSLSP